MCGFQTVQNATAVQTAMQYDENMVYCTHKPVLSEVAETKSDDIKKYSFHCLYWKLCDQKFIVFELHFIHQSLNTKIRLTNNDNKDLIRVYRKSYAPKRLVVM